MTRCFPIRELAWLMPFICIGLVIVSLLRPTPKFSIPVEGRTVVDAEGTKVHIAIPFHGVALTWPVWTGGYLEVTQAPGSLVHAGGSEARIWFSREVTNWIYPQVGKEDKLWDDNKVSYGHTSNGEIESLLAFDPGVYIGAGGYFGLVPLLRRVGLPAFSSRGPAISEDEGRFRSVMVVTALIERPERGEALIASYRQAFADLENELQPMTLTNRPRVLIVASSTRNRALVVAKSKLDKSYQPYLAAAGVENVATDRREDAERILALDPDVIFFFGYERLQDFTHDLRWRDLKAIKTNRVYKMPGANPGMLLAGLHFQPLWARWMAEILYPDRMQPKLRRIMRDHFSHEFSYRLSDEQIDELLHIDENKVQFGYDRFSRDFPITVGQSVRIR